MNKLCSKIIIAVPFAEVHKESVAIKVDLAYKNKGINETDVFCNAFSRAWLTAAGNSLLLVTRNNELLYSISRCLRELFEKNINIRKPLLANFTKEMAAVTDDPERCGFLLEVVTRLREVDGVRCYVPSVTLSFYHLSDADDIVKDDFVKGDIIFTGEAGEKRLPLYADTVTVDIRYNCGEYGERKCPLTLLTEEEHAEWLYSAKWQKTREELNLHLYK